MRDEIVQWHIDTEFVTLKRNTMSSRTSRISGAHKVHIFHKKYNQIIRYGCYIFFSIHARQISMRAERHLGEGRINHARHTASALSLWGRKDKTARGPTTGGTVQLLGRILVFGRSELQQSLIRLTPESWVVWCTLEAVAIAIYLALQILIQCATYKLCIRYWVNLCLWRCKADFLKAWWGHVQSAVDIYFNLFSTIVYIWL